MRVKDPAATAARRLAGARCGWEIRRSKEQRSERDRAAIARMEELLMKPTIGREQLAYAAGLFDGEGCVSLYKIRDDPQGPTYQLQTTVVLRQKEPLQRLLDQFGGSLTESKKRDPRWAPCWRWRHWSGGAADFLMAISPWLQVKQSQAALGIFFQSQRRRGGRRLPEEAMAQFEQAGLMRWLNQKGPRDEKAYSPYR
jgi:hypothetical protein